MQSNVDGIGRPAAGDIAERLERIEALEDEILELIEIEAYAATQKRKPRAKLYAFRVGKLRIEVRDPIITGRRILELAGKMPPEKYTLRQVEHGGILKPIELTDEVDLRAPGIERFRAMPRTAQTVDPMPAPDPQNLRRQFRLPPEDESFLNSLGRPWEAVTEAGQNWVLLYGESVPPATITGPPM